MVGQQISIYMYVETINNHNPTLQKWNDFRQQFQNKNSLHLCIEGIGLMVFNTTFNNITFISWWSVLLVEETGVARENYRPAASH